MSPSGTPDSRRPFGAVTIHVEVRTITPNRLVREHHFSRASRRNRERRAVRDAIVQAERDGVELPPLPAIATFTRVGPNRIDGDSLAYSLKSPRDELSRIYRVDDADHLGHLAFRYEQERVWEPVRVKAKGGFRNALRTYLRIKVEPLVERAIGGCEASCADGAPVSCTLAVRHAQPACTAARRGRH